MTQEAEAHSRVPLDEAEEVLRRDRLHDDVVESDHRRGPWFVGAGEGTELADELAGSAHGNEHVATVGRGADDLQTTRSEDQHVVAAITLEDQERTTAMTP